MTARQLTTALVVLAFTTAPVSAQPRNDRKRSNEEIETRTDLVMAPFRSVVAKVHPSTVRIKCDDKDAALGTVVFAEGYILTKASELFGVVSVRLPDGDRHKAELVGVHKPTDLALLKIGTELTPISFGDVKKPVVGHWLAAAGPTTSAPLAVGIVSVTTRELKGSDALIRNKNSGFLGIQMFPDEEDGVKVDSVLKEGGALKAGVKRNDIIVELNGKTVTSQEALKDLLDEFRPGDEVTLKVKREGKTIAIPVTLAPRPKDKSDIQNGMGSELSSRRTGFPVVVQTDMVVEPKNCGGPVVDLDGNVLGINIARAGRVETWILPADTIRPLLTDLKAGKYPPVLPKKDDDK